MLIPPLGGDHRPGHSAFEERLKNESSFHSSSTSLHGPSAVVAMAASGSVSSSGSTHSSKLSLEERTAIAQREQDEKDALNDEVVYLM